MIRENWNLKFSACFIACPLTIYKSGKTPIPPPEAVSVMADPGGNATNKLKVEWAFGDAVVFNFLSNRSQIVILYILKTDGLIRRSMEQSTNICVKLMNP